MITKNATACLLAGTAVGVGISSVIGSAGATSRSVPDKPKPAAVLTVSGDGGRYLEFAGVQRTLGTYAGRLKFKRPVKSGKYTLVVTFKNSRVVYDVTARQR